MTSRREVPTALPYVTLRNWQETRLHHPANSASEADLALVRYEEPCLVHVNFQAFVRTVLDRIDAGGRVHSQAGLTGREEVSSPIPLGNLSGMDEDARAQSAERLQKNCTKRQTRSFDRVVCNNSQLTGKHTSIWPQAMRVMWPVYWLPSVISRNSWPAVAAIAAQAQAEGRLTIPDFEGQAETARSSPL